MVELTWCYGWSKWKAKDDTETVYFLWDVTGKLPFAMVASKHSDSPAQYINIYLPTFSQSNTWDFCLVMTRTSENITANITENVWRCSENHWEHLKLFRRRQFWCVSFSLEHKVIIHHLSWPGLLKTSQQTLLKMCEDVVKTIENIWSYSEDNNFGVFRFH